MRTEKREDCKQRWKVEAKEGHKGPEKNSEVFECQRSELSILYDQES